MGESAVDRDLIAPFAKVAALSLIVVLVDQLAQIGAMARDLPFGGTDWRFQVAALFLVRGVPIAVMAALTAIAGRLGGKPRVESLGRWVLLGVAPIFILSAISVWFDGAAVRKTVPAENVAAFGRQWGRLLALALVSIIGITWIWRSRAKKPE